MTITFYTDKHALYNFYTKNDIINMLINYVDYDFFKIYSFETDILSKHFDAFKSKLKEYVNVSQETKSAVKELTRIFALLSQHDNDLRLTKEQMISLLNGDMPKLFI